MAAVTLPIWDSALPQAGRWNVTGGPQMNVVSFKPEVGPAIDRRRASSIVRQYSIELPPMDMEQYAVWQNWFHEKLSDGVMPFIWVNPITKEFSVCKFIQSGENGYDESMFTNDSVSVRFSLAVLRKVANTAFNKLFGEAGIWVDAINDRAAIIREDGMASYGRILDFFSFTRASIATYIGADRLLHTATAGELRYDHDPITGAQKGVLLEGARTNRALYSENSSEEQIQSDVTVSNNTGIAPDGTETADAIIENDQNSTHFIGRSGIVINANAYHCVSRFVRANGRNIGRIWLDDGTFTDGFFADFNLVTKNVTHGTNGNGEVIASGIQEFPFGLFRVWVAGKVNASATSALSMLLLSDGTSLTYQGDDASGMETWGHQIEVGTFPTSYIPTTSVSIQRNTDVLSAQLSALPFNAAEGTMFVEGSIDRIATTNSAGDLMSLSDGSANNRIGFPITSSNNSIASVVDSTVQQADISSGDNGGPAGSIRRGAMAWRVNDFAASFYGNTPGTDVSGSIPTVDRLTIGARFGSSTSLFGHIRAMALFPRRRSNADLQTLSATA